MNTKIISPVLRANQLPKIESKGRSAVKKNSNIQNRNAGTVNPEGRKK